MVSYDNTSHSLINNDSLINNESLLSNKTFEKYSDITNKDTYNKYKIVGYVMEYNGKKYKNKYAIFRLDENGITIEIIKASLRKSKCNLTMSYSDILRWQLKEQNNYTFLFINFYINDIMHEIKLLVQDNYDKIENAIIHNISIVLIKTKKCNTLEEAKKLF